MRASDRSLFNFSLHTYFIVVSKRGRITLENLLGQTEKRVNDGVSLRYVCFSLFNNLFFSDGNILEIGIHAISDSFGPESVSDHLFYLAVSHQHHSVPSRFTILYKCAQPMSDDDHCVTPPRELILNEALDY